MSVLLPVVGILNSCMSYPYPYGSTSLRAKPPKYRVSGFKDVGKTDQKQILLDEPPPYSEKPVVAQACKIDSPATCRLSRYQFACPACKFRYFRKKLRTLVVKQRKAYSAVTVQIDRLTSEQYEEDDFSGIVDLIEVIRIQESGPTEAARALRKKLKYGGPHRQIRALAILDGLIQNAGSRFQRTFADEPLLERLRTMARDDMVDSEVREKCNVLFYQWATAYKNTPGLERIASLHKQLPTMKRAAPTQSKVLRDTEPEADHDSEDVHSRTMPGHARSSSSVNASSHPAPPMSRPVTLSTMPSPQSSSKFFKSGKKDKSKPFSLEREKPNILSTIASASVSSTNLLNALQLVNREHERVSDNKEVMSRFETCKTLRRQTLRYIQLVESEEWIGSLLSANDELVKALTAFEIFDKSVENDSDSDAWEQVVSATGREKVSMADQLGGLTLGEAAPTKPQRPTSLAMPPPQFAAKRRDTESDEEDADEEEDEDNPFGDANAVKTPGYERPGMTWREV
ncbi:hypothetical protein LTR66_008590 [Elasticomyces elasticus]|nr:hypothetical protein LTR66_008590 [Elasticomyces elasticus]